MVFKLLSLRALFIIIAFAAPALIINASDKQSVGYLEISTDDSKKKLYYQYKKAKRGSSTYVFLNGLTNTTDDWQQTVNALLKQDPGVGVLLFDFPSQGRSLDSALSNPSFRFPSEYPALHQAVDAASLITSLGIKSPIVTVGLSYGGGIAFLLDVLFPQLSSQTILIAPYVEAFPGAEADLQKMVKTSRFWFPLNPYSDEQIYQWLLRQSVHYSIPSSEPQFSGKPNHVEAIYRMIKGIRGIGLHDYIHSYPDGRRLTLLQPSADEYVTQKTFDSFWSAIPNDQKVGRVLLQDTGHRVPTLMPEDLAELLNLVVNDQSLFSKHNTVYYSPFTDGPCAAKFATR